MFNQIWQWFIGSPYAKMAAFLVVLVTVDFLSGVLVALKNKTFDWRNLGMIFPNNVIPLVFGWVGLVLLVQSLSLINLPADILALVANYLAPGIDGVFYLGAVGTLLGSIFSNYQEVFPGQFKPLVVAAPDKPAP